MATLLGTTFSFDDKVTTQCDVASIGKTQKTLVVKVNQTAYEAMINSRTTPRTATTSTTSKVCPVWVPKTAAQSVDSATKTAVQSKISVVSAVAQSASTTPAQSAIASAQTISYAALSKYKTHVPLAQLAATLPA